MLCQKQQDLDEMVAEAKKEAKKGEVATYIPALAKADPNILAVSIFDGASHCFVSGDSEHLFTLQSASKVITLALAERV